MLYYTHRDKEKEIKKMTYEEMMKMVEELRKQGKEPHGELREALIDYQVNH